jgi:predicted esterase
LVEKAGVKGTFNSYKMGHSACAEELKAVASFIKGVLSEPKL